MTVVRRRPQNLARAVEENETEFLFALGRAGGGEERRDERVHWTIGGSPIGYHNCVVRAELSSEDADEVIAASVEVMRDKGVCGSWHVGPSMRPHDLGNRLVAHGFEGGPEPGMAADLDLIPDTEPVPGLAFEQVIDREGLDAYESVLAAGFGEGPPEARWVCEMYARIGLGDDTGWRHLVGRIHGDPVATASLFFAADVAGLYFACTHPDHRRHGIGTALTHEAMVVARECGYGVAVLGSSPMGHHIYQRMGFRDVCDVNVYEWSPD